MSNLMALFDDDDFETNCVTHEAPFPVMLLVNGLPYSRTLRCRWATTSESRIEDIQILCPKCSSRLTVQNLEQGTFGVLTSSLDCPRCHWRAVALGSSARVREILSCRIATADSGYCFTERMAEIL